MQPLFLKTQYKNARARVYVYVCVCGVSSLGIASPCGSDVSSIGITLTRILG
jgi:hypothetical protein